MQLHILGDTILLEWFEFRTSRGLNSKFHVFLHGHLQIDTRHTVLRVIGEVGLHGQGLCVLTDYLEVNCQGGVLVS